MEILTLRVGFLITASTVVLARHMCTDERWIKHIQVNTSLTVASFETYPGLGLLKCVRECQLRRLCQSFNYILTSDICQMNNISSIEAETMSTAINTYFSNIADWPKQIAGACEKHECPRNAVCKVTDNKPSCEITYCFGTLRPPANNHLMLDKSTGLFRVGDKVPFRCPTGYHKTGELLCGENGEWTGRGTCHRPPGSFSLLRTCNSSYTDGEYWQAAHIAGGIAVKLYGHNVRSDESQRWITLPDDSNFSEFPYQGSANCATSSWEFTWRGTTTFNKIRVTFEQGRIRTIASHEFATTTGFMTIAMIGSAGSCNLRCSNHTPKRFQINTTGTGFIVDPRVTWNVSAGFVDVTRSDDNRVINGVCHSNCTPCLPATNNNQLYFVLDPTYQPPEDAATVPICN